MCGICGIASKPGRADDLDRAAVLAMVDRLSHRGPDGRGVLTLRPPAVKRPVTLGHTRLAIIDLSDAGRQPMSSDDGRVHLILNGEVYNHRRLRDGLTKRGYRFRSTCDTEVVLRLYEERGPDSIAELEGMFALAVLDTSRQILLLARDPLGIKPLYYHEGEQGLIFGSEIKAILASGLYRTEVEWQGIWDYFTYLYVPCPHTAYRGVRQLPPAHLLEHDLATGATTLSRYWCVRSRPEIARLSFADAKAMLREQLTTVVRDQLVADVPVGVFLSSGADSTVVAGLARAESHDIHSYTVVFDDPALSAYDERAGRFPAPGHQAHGAARRPYRPFRPSRHASALRSAVRQPDGAPQLPVVDPRTEAYHGGTVRRRRRRAVRRLPALPRRAAGACCWTRSSLASAHAWPRLLGYSR